MSRNTKDFLCIIICAASLLLSFTVILTTSVSISEITRENEVLSEIVRVHGEMIRDQNKAIEDNKLYVDNVVRNITEGEW